MGRSQVQDNHSAMHAGLRWQVPDRFNIAEVCCRRWASGSRAAEVAIRAHEPGGAGQAFTYAQLQRDANRLSNALALLGVRRGDCVGIVMPQRFETAVAYMAVLQMGAVAMPLSMLFGPEALEYRLHDSEAVVAICDEGSIESLLAVRENCPLLTQVIGVGAAGAHAGLEFSALIAQEPDGFTPVASEADDPAVLIYTSGTTGNPKGALIPHRALIGNLTGFVCSQNWFGFPPDGVGEPAPAVFWSPADWAWTGGLMDALLPTLYFGQTIVAFNGRFGPELAFDILERQGVTHTFLFPTALKAMMKAVPEPRARFALRLQAIMSAGEAVGDAVFAYCRDRLGVIPNEMFGQTEINYIVGNCAMNGVTDRGVGWPARPNSMGRPYPGHRVAVIDENGEECPPGVVGDVALHRLDVHGEPDPIFFLGYWKNEAATHAKFTADWCRTGDLAVCDAEGYLWYQGRADDVFKSAGYRIGPGEIENCLVKHVAVANAAVVPKPDPDRGAVVKAYVVLAPDASDRRAREVNQAGDVGGAAFDDALRSDLQAHVKTQLAPYEYPKEIEFIDQLPMTTTGKVQRRVLRLQEEARARQAALAPNP
jgi:acetyl-CoA synthetase